MQRTLLIILVFTILVAIFALQNSAAVTIRLWFWSPDTSLALVVILTFTAGALMGIALRHAAEQVYGEYQRSAKRMGYVWAQVNPARAGDRAQNDTHEHASRQMVRCIPA